MTFGTPARGRTARARRVSVVNTSPKISKSRDAGRPRRRADLRRPGAEERAVDVLRRVDPEAVELVAANPVAVDRGEPRHDERLLREEVVEPEEVTLLEAGSRADREVDVAAVVVPRHVVEPRRAASARGRCGQDERLPRHGSALEAREHACPRSRGGDERPAPAVAVRHSSGPGTTMPPVSEITSPVWLTTTSR